MYDTHVLFLSLLVCMNINTHIYNIIDIILVTYSIVRQNK